MTTIGAADYARISSDPGNDAKGVTRQTGDSQARIEREPSWHHVGSYVDNDLSATKGKERPHFERLLADVRAGRVKVIVIYMTGRFVRNRRERVHTYELLAKHGVRLVCTNGPDLDFSTPAGRMVAGIMGEVDAHEVEQLADRASREWKQAAEEGRPRGGKLFGYRPDPVAPKHHKQRVIVPEQAEGIREATARILDGQSRRQVALWLNAQGLRTTRGGLWNHKNLAEMLTNPGIAGLRAHKGTVIGPAMWDPIISADDHTRLVRLLAKHQMPPGWSNRHSHLLSGIARCGKCLANGREVGISHRFEAGRRRYICPAPERGGCRGLSMLAEMVEPYVEETVVRLLGEPGVIKQLAAADEPDAAEALRIAEGLEACKARAEAVGEQMADDDPNDEVTKLARKAALDKIRVEMTKLREREAELTHASAVADLLGVEDIAYHWEHVMTLARKRATISALVTITLMPAGRGSKATTDHVVIERRRSPRTARTV